MEISVDLEALKKRYSFRTNQSIDISFSRVEWDMKSVIFALEEFKSFTERQLCKCRTDKICDRCNLLKTYFPKKN